MKIINKCQRIFVTFGVVVTVFGTAFAQTYYYPSTPPPQPATGPMIYPSRGQTQQQMQQDKADCYAWAKQQTGYDPMAAAQQAQGVQQPAPYYQPAPPPPSGGIVRGGVGGAAAGAAIGAIAGNAGKGAAIGAASGGAIGGLRQRQARNAQEQAMAQQQAAQQQTYSQQQAVNQQTVDAYNRAFQACMEGKGYTVR